MPRRGKKTYTDFFDEPAGRNSGLAQTGKKYLDFLEERNYSKVTISGKRLTLSLFFEWLHDRGVREAAEVTREIIERYQRFLYHYRNEHTGKGITFRTQHTRLVILRNYFAWLSKRHYILYNPAADIELPRYERSLPKHILNPHEVEAVLGVPDIEEPLGLRDRAMLEMLYSTGMRRMELINLKKYDIDFESGLIIIRKGKGKKDRRIPAGSRALHWVDRYIREIRPRLAVEPDEGYIFLTNEGLPFTPNRLSKLTKDLIQAANIEKSGSCHLFRHTMATLMLENGADLRYIQAMLGHASIETTQIYTQVGVRKLKEVHDRTHPAENPEALKNRVDDAPVMFEAKEEQAEEDGQRKEAGK